MGLCSKEPPSAEELMRRGLDADGKPLPKKEAAPAPKKAAPKPSSKRTK